MAQYKSYGRIQIQGSGQYVNGVTACLDLIESVADGQRLLQAISSTRHTVTIVHTDKGNSCTPGGNGAFPILTLAIKNTHAGNFKSELNVAIGKAKAAGMTLEHFARQLSTGLTPATYVGAANVVRPGQKSPAAPGSSARDVMMHAGLQTAVAIKLLQDLMAGTSTVADLPADWTYDLPRLLRLYMTPGPGADSQVNFNRTKTFHCEDDPAMHQRPPAIGLAHELIHALHNSRGKNLRFVAKNNEKLEEVVTTGMAPYNFEDPSDNKLRTQWPSQMHLRENY